MDCMSFCILQLFLLPLRPLYVLLFLLLSLLLTIVDKALSQHAANARSTARDEDGLACHVKETADGER